MKKKIIPTIYFFFSILFLLWVFYKDRIFFNGEALEYYKIYYFIGFFCLISSIITFKLNKNINQIIFIILCSVIFSFYSFESYLIYLDYSKKPDLKKIKDFNLKSPIGYYLQNKKIDPKITISLIPRYSLNDKSNQNNNFFPLAGISNKKTIHCNELGFFSTYFSDRYGFNNDDNSWEEKEINYLLIGDSLVHGSCVMEPDTISGNIKKIEKTLSVLNLGQGGNGPLLNLATLREYLPNKKIKRILYFHTEGTDLFNLKSELRDPRLREYFSDKKYSQNLKTKQYEIDSYLEKYIDQLLKKKIEYQGNINLKLKLFTSSNLLKFIKLYNLRTLVIPRQVPKEFEKILHEIKKISEEINATFYFIYVPDYLRYVGINNHSYFFNYGDVLSILNQNNINFIDINKEFLKLKIKPKELFAQQKALHFNEYGYKILAEIVLKEIKKFEN